LAGLYTSFGLYASFSLYTSFDRSDDRVQAFLLGVKVSQRFYDVHREICVRGPSIVDEYAGKIQQICGLNGYR